MTYRSGTTIMRKNSSDTRKASGSPSVPENVWNNRSSTFSRDMDPSRPWYSYALQLIEDHRLHSGRALDVGCGLGEFMDMLKNKGFNVTGVDGDPRHIDGVRQSGFDAFIADLESPLPFNDSSFDLAACLEVIEHIALAEGLLKEIARILAPGGHVVLSTPNFSCWQNRIRYLVGRGPVEEGIHLRFFTPRSLQQALRAAGFEAAGRASFGPLTGVNFLRRRFGLRPKSWAVPEWLEGLFAEHLLLIARKQ
ncbi:MAG: hypothetical protein C0402_16735 [Thermodesulfovibrio sp.]|nr:hypothetical protein [Thermodesulfovibrio sp.]